MPRIDVPEHLLSLLAEAVEEWWRGPEDLDRGDRCATRQPTNSNYPSDRIRYREARELIERAQKGY